MLARLFQPKVEVGIVVGHVASIGVCCHSERFIVFQEVGELEVVSRTTRTRDDAGDQPGLGVETNMRLVAAILDLFRRHVTVWLRDRALAFMNQGGIGIPGALPLLLATPIGIVVDLATVWTLSTT